MKDNVRVIMFASRNKDNHKISYFKERHKIFISDLDDEQLKIKFDEFVSKGQFGEMSRMYASVNYRDMSKVHSAFLHYLIDHPDTNYCALDGIIAGIAAKKENALTRRWMFDFDVNNAAIADQFCKELSTIDETLNPVKYKTPNGYAIIIEHGFDERRLDPVWKEYDISIKKDDLLCVAWKIHLRKEPNHD